MNSESHRGHRRSLRLKNYDYAQAGAYFVTTCIHDRQCLLGTVAGDVVRLNEVGRMVERCWRKLPERFDTVEVDEFVVMPNHFHAVALLTANRTSSVGAAPRGRPGLMPEEGRPHGGAPTVGDVMDWFKTMTTNDYIRGVKERGWKPFAGKLWQRNYYEHVIRSEDALELMRRYIRDNPPKWSTDPENPQAQRVQPKGRWQV